MGVRTLLTQQIGAQWSPALAMPAALKRARMELKMSVLLVCESIRSLKVLGVVKIAESDGFAREARLGRKSAVGEIDRDRLNVHGALSLWDTLSARPVLEW